MKKFLPIILIAAFLFPVLGHAATAPLGAPKPVVTATQAASPTQTTTPVVTDTTPTKTDISSGLTDILNRLTDLSSQTQLTINQINATGINTDQPQAEIISANISLANAKLDIDKSNFKTAGGELYSARVSILESLSELQASLPAIGTSN